jgi:LuxR family quorum-sensing transcriptional regulator LasR
MELPLSFSGNTTRRSLITSHSSSGLLAGFQPLLDAASDTQWTVALVRQAVEMGFDFVLYAPLPNVVSGFEHVWIRSNYPDTWRSRYDEQGYASIDPTVMYCLVQSLPLVWSPDIFASARQKTLYQEAVHHGIRAGISLPVHGPNGRVGMLCLVKDTAPDRTFWLHVARLLPSITHKPDKVTRCIPWEHLANNTMNIGEINKPRNRTFMKHKGLLPSSIWLLVIWTTVSGFGLFERTSSWKEEVVLSDNTSVWLEREIVRGPDAFFRPGRGGTSRSSMSGEIPGIGKIEFDWNTHEVPISFDVIDGVPWVAIPIAGPDQCEKYGFPKESVIAFALRGKEWVNVPFQDAPKVLRYNILTSPPLNSKVARADYFEKKSTTYRKGPGQFLTEAYIPEPVQWEHSCPRINSVQSAEQTLSVQQFLGLTPISSEAKVIEILTDMRRVDRVEDYRGVLARNDLLKDEYVVSNCDGKIGRVESIRPWVKQGGGMMTSSASSIRIELLQSKDGRKNIWLPARRPNGGQPNLVKCIGSNGYALINHWSGVVDLVIAKFDMEGKWHGIWRFRYPDAPFKERSIIQFDESSDGVRITAGQVNHVTSKHEGDPFATIWERYVLEVPLK